MRLSPYLQSLVLGGLLAGQQFGMAADTKPRLSVDVTDPIVLKKLAENPDYRKAHDDAFTYLVNTGDKAFAKVWLAHLDAKLAASTKKADDSTAQQEAYKAKTKLAEQELTVLDKLSGQDFVKRYEQMVKELLTKYGDPAVMPLDDVIERALDSGRILKKTADALFSTLNKTIRENDARWKATKVSAAPTLTGQALAQVPAPVKK